MDKIHEGVREMSNLKGCIPCDNDIQDLINSFNEAVNKSREDMGETKKNWTKKYKKVCRDLDFNGKNHMTMSENMASSLEILSEGLKAISSLTKQSYSETRSACKVFLERYNTAVKKLPKKNKAAKITITESKLKCFIGEYPTKRGRQE